MLQNIKKSFHKVDATYLPSIFLFGLVVFFWTMFDSMLMYVTPLLMQKQGFTIATIGMIIGTSSVAGAFFDVLICKFFKNADFRRAFLVMFAICSLYPLLLSNAQTVWVYLFAMGVWGMYFDLYSFGAFNFVGHFTKKKDHAGSFGVIQFFRALGGMIAPFVAGFVIARSVDWQIFAASWIFLVMSGVFFVILLFVIHMRKSRGYVAHQPSKSGRSFVTEIRLWRRLGKIMTPVLCVTFFLALVESFFWTLGPLYVVSQQFGKFGGLLVTAYIMPALFAGWIVGILTNRFGKKRIALLGILIGSTILVSFVHVAHPLVAILTVFCAACFISVAFPAINAAYADYISEAPRVDNEIESLEDMSFNSGYIIGPIAAGVLAQFLGIPGAFSVLGLIGVVLAAILLVTTPKNIVIRVPRSALK